MGDVSALTKPETQRGPSMSKRKNLWLPAGLFGALALLVTAGCAAPQSEEGTTTARAEEDAEEGEGRSCEKERSTGSNIARKVCRDPEQSEKRREEDQKALRESDRWGCQGSGCND